MQLVRPDNLVSCVPGKTVPESYRTTDTHCDHCQTDRNRKEIFVLAHDDGRFCQVGRSCIADFLGHVSVDNLIARAEWLMALTNEIRESNEWGGGRGEITRNTEHFVQTVTICIRRLGWMSRKMAEERALEMRCPQTTASLAWQVLTDKSRATAELVAEADLHVEERDEVLAVKALEWARGLAGDNDYIYNLGAACRCEYVTYKTIGIVASVIAAYNKHVERLQEFERTKKVRSLVGVVGERQGFAGLTVKKLLYVEGNYGTKTLCRFEDANGNVLVWWASSNTDWLTEGETIDITATVKKHGDYKGTPQTELQRVAKGLPAAKKPRKTKKTALVVETCAEPIPF